MLLICRLPDLSKLGILHLCLHEYRHFYLKLKLLRIIVIIDRFEFWCGLFFGFFSCADLLRGAEFAGTPAQWERQHICVCQGILGWMHL